MGKTKSTLPSEDENSPIDVDIYLVVCDDSDDFPVALRYAAMLSKINHGHLALLHATNFDDFVHWGNVEDRMRKDMRERAEKVLWSVANQVYEINEMIPGLYIEEGELREVVVDVINRESKIRGLILGAQTGGTGPGPLVSYFTGKGISRLKVPLIMVPDHADMARLEELSRVSK